MKKKSKLFLWFLLITLDTIFSCILPVIKVDEYDKEELQSHLRGSIVYSYILYLLAFFFFKMWRKAIKS